MANQLQIIEQNNNPYFLSSNESPTVVLVTPLLNGKNYHSWARSMRLSLDSKNKLDFIDEILTRPPQDDPMHNSWKRIADLLHDFYHLDQGTLTISEYFTELKTFWDEIETFRPIPNCKCGAQRICGIVQLIRTYREQNYVIKFLKGLTEQYAQVRSQIMFIDPLPNTTKVFSMLKQQERQFNLPILSTLDPETRILSISTKQEQDRSTNNVKKKTLNST
ncbi:hypothetical protein Lal_00036773 [Lupinus albus]|nr:hypothetical protein Lal_00036773 [Lupinus albus]